MVEDKSINQTVSTCHNPLAVSCPDDVGSHSEIQERYLNVLRQARLNPTVFEALMSLAPAVDNSILFAMLTRCKYPWYFFHSHHLTHSLDRMMDPNKKFNFKTWALRRDLDETRSHSSKRPPRLIQWLSSEFIPKEIRHVDEPRGFFITDHSGTPMVFVLRNIVSPELHVSFNFLSLHVSPLI